jgi:hypothetical protein
MKYSVFLMLLFFICCSINSNHTNAQSSIDSLGKYSYAIFAIEHGHQHTGTAFFYFSNDTTFLVSNYHAIKGVDPLHKKIDFKTDTLWLKYKLKNSNRYKVIPLDISENKIGKTEMFSMIERIDLLKIPIIKPNDGEIFYINDLIDKSYFTKTPDSIILFGHPSPEGNISMFYSSQRKLLGTCNKRGFVEFDSAFMAEFPTLPKADRAKLNGASQYYFFIKPVGEGGYSGSPVFGKFMAMNKKAIYKFIGVICASEPRSGQSWVIRGDVTYKYLKSQ